MSNKTATTETKHLTVGQFAKLHGVSLNTVRRRLYDGEVKGAYRVSDARSAKWLIPEDADFTSRAYEHKRPVTGLVACIERLERAIARLTSAVVTMNKKKA